MNSSPSTKLRSLSSPSQLVVLAVVALISVYTTPFTSAAFINTHTANPTTSTSSISSALLHRQFSVSSSASSSPRHRYHQISPVKPSSSSSLSARKKQPKDRSSYEGPAYTVEDPTAFLGNFRFIVPALFLAQVVFLAAAQQTSGNENLDIYGNEGNAYIRSNGGYDMSKGIVERVGIQSKGQQIWYNNVFRDLKNGGPVYPPISEP